MAKVNCIKCKTPVGGMTGKLRIGWGILCPSCVKVIVGDRFKENTGKRKPKNIFEDLFKDIF